jgi:hypothetical protein
MARCKLYEIKGPDARRTAGAERCVRESTGDVVIDGRRYRLCNRHQESRWERFVEDGWLYGVDPKSEPLTKRKKKDRKK